MFATLAAATFAATLATRSSIPTVETHASIPTVEIAPNVHLPFLTMGQTCSATPPSKSCGSCGCATCCAGCKLEVAGGLPYCAET